MIIDNWNSYEKFAFLKCISFPDAVLIAAAQIEWDVELFIADWTKTLRDNFFKELGLDYNMIVNLARKVIEQVESDNDYKKYAIALSKLLKKKKTLAVNNLSLYQIIFLYINLRMQV